MKRFEKTTFVIYEFMTELLGLSGCELLVFALLYSFCRGAGGAFWGSRQYLSERLGISVSSVDRAVKCLKLKGLIYTLVDEYRIDMKALAERCEKAEKEKNRKKAVEKSLNRNLKTEKTQFEESSSSEKREEFVNLTANNKEYNKEDIEDNNLSVCLSGERAENKKILNSGREYRPERTGKSRREPSERRRDYFDILDTDIGPVRVMPLGRGGVVEMSEEQYNHLCELVPPEKVDSYIFKMEKYILEEGEILNPYVTVLKWIRQDYLKKQTLW